MAAEGLASLSATGLLFYGGITTVIAAQTCGLLVLAAAMVLREPRRANSGYKPHSRRMPKFGQCPEFAVAPVRVDAPASCRPVSLAGGDIACCLADAARLG